MTSFGSRAHVRMLGRTRLITDDEMRAILAALDTVDAELSSGMFLFAPTDEDIHTAIERRVTEIAGDAGAKLHTGRSRNDQVATALRLFVRREGAVIAEVIHDLQAVLVERAGQAGTDVYLPGYTHLQRAQPVLLAHHLLAHFWALDRDLDRLRDALRAPTYRRWARARWLVRACLSTPMAPPPISGSPSASTTLSTRSPTATSWPSAALC